MCSWISCSFMDVNILWNSLVLKSTKVVLTNVKTSIYWYLSYSIYAQKYSLAPHEPKYPKISSFLEPQHFNPYIQENNDILCQLMPFCKENWVEQKRRIVQWSSGCCFGDQTLIIVNLYVPKLSAYTVWFHIHKVYK